MAVTAVRCPVDRLLDRVSAVQACLPTRRQKDYRVVAFPHFPFVYNISTN